MPKNVFELALYGSLATAPQGYACIYLYQIRKPPQGAYVYQVAFVKTSDTFIYSDAIAQVIAGWQEAYSDPQIINLSRQPIACLYSAHDSHKQAVIKSLKDARKQNKPSGSIDIQAHRLKRHIVTTPTGDELTRAWETLASAVNAGQLAIPESHLQQLRTELAGSYDWEQGIRAMPLLLAAFCQAFAHLPLEVKATAAQAYAKKAI